MRASSRHRDPAAAPGFWRALADRFDPRSVLPLTAFAAVTALLGVTALAPYSVALEAVHAAEIQREAQSLQRLDIQDVALAELGRDLVETAERRAVVPVAAVPDPGTAKAYALERVLSQGWSSAEYDCLVMLWQRESGWRVNAENRSSGAYGIPQALPGNKMASAGADWRTNYKTQIKWGLGYVKNRYKTPCGAWQHFTVKNWY